MSVWPSVYDWDKIVNEYEGRLNILDCSIDSIGQDINNNTILFSLSNSGRECKAEAFFRHLRNAFAHHRIVRERDNYFITDMLSNGKFSMYGIVNAELLKNFCFSLFEEKDRAIGIYNSEII